MSSMKSQLEKQTRTYHYELFNMITNEFSGKDFTTDELMEKFFGLKNFTPKEVKKVKDPDAPKRAQSAYFIFCGEKRPDVMDKMKKNSSEGKVDVTAVSKELGEMWRNMSEKDKKPFAKKANKDKERYVKEKEDYEKSKADA